MTWKGKKCNSSEYPARSIAIFQEAGFVETRYLDEKVDTKGFMTGVQSSGHPVLDHFRLSLLAQCPTVDFCCTKWCPNIANSSTLADNDFADHSVNLSPGPPSYPCIQAPTRNRFILAVYPIHDDGASCSWQKLRNEAEAETFRTFACHAVIGLLRRWNSFYLYRAQQWSLNPLSPLKPP